MNRLLISLLAAAFALSAASPVAVRFTTVYVQDRPFRVEIADTPEKHALGLMHRPCLKEGYGMLFVFTDEEVRSFWMKNTLVALDMIFINGDRLVVDIVHSAPPCRADPCPSFTSAYPARFVLELAGGTAETLRLKVGDKIFIAID